MKVYLIPGLGADRRMYQQQLNVFPTAEVIEYFLPEKGETLTSYAQKMGEKIDTSQPYILIGTSLGGIISMELSRILSPHKIILIASIKNRNEMPLLFRSMKYLKLHRVLSGNTIKKFNKLMIKRLDSRNDSEAAQIIRQMTEDVPSEFIEWAMDAVVKWNPPVEYRSDIIHLHGTNDRLFPFSKIKNAVAVENGSHIMNMTLGSEVNRLLLQAVNSH